MTRSSNRNIRHLLLLGGAFGGLFGCLPVSVEAEDADTWSNPDGEEQLYLIAEALVKSGFPGIRIPVFEVVNGSVLSVWPHSGDTIEGQYFAELFEKVRSGLPLPEVSKAVAAVNARYAQSGLISPASCLS